MKKYLMTAMAAVAMGVAFTSCSHNTDLYGGEEGGGKINGRTAQEQIELDKAVYKAAFEQSFGKVAPTVDWGFGSSTRAMTRVGLPEAPSFSKKETAINPKKPTEPTFTRTFYNKLSDASGAIYSGSVADDNAWNAISNAIVYIDSKSSKVGSNSQNMTIIVKETMEFNAGNLNTNGNGPVICVPEDITLTLTGMKQNITIYLAPRANLIATQVSSFANCNLIMSGNNTVTGGAMNFSYGSIVNKGGTITATSIQLDNSTNLWNEGTINVSGSLNSNNQNSNIYNANTITAASMTLDQKATLWNEGTIQLKNSDGTYTTSNKLEGKNTNIIIYNASGKTIELGSIELKSSAPEILYNDGTVTCHGEISLDNTADEIINNGTLTATSLNMKAGGKMYNTATTNISGLTKISNTNCQWQNDGQYTSGSFEVDRYAVKNYNNCKLTVNGNFWLNRGKFVLNGAASVICNSFTFEDTSYFFMGGKSLLSVTGELLGKNANSDYGFYGVGSDYAVIQARSVKKGSDSSKFAAAYFGKLFIDTEDHFPQGETNAQGTFYIFDDDVKFSFTDNTDVSGFQTSGAKTAKKAENFSIDITADAKGCNPGYKYGTKSTYRVIAEDLTARQGSDFDFNDVVFDVDPDADGTGATITILAAGGIWPLTINGVEVHEKLIENIQKFDYKDKETGETYQCYPMINTGVTDEKKGAFTDYEPTIRVTTGTWDKDENIRNSINTEIVLKVFKYGDTSGTELKANEGVPTCKILVDRSYSINSERNNISDGTRFKDYVQGKIGTRVWW